MAKVLFSPLGNSDPIASGFDGPMLHILRHYQPEKVILYATKEMQALEKKDGRYTQAISLLEEELGCSFDVYFEQATLKGEELVSYDVFYNEFRQILENIAQENSGGEILVNISSGTPQMKATLYALKRFSAISMTLLQTLLAKTSEKRGIKEEFNLQKAWEENRDNLENAKNRVHEEQAENLLFEMIKENVKKLIERYDYNGALVLLEPYKERLPEAYKCIETAQALRLDTLRQKSPYSPEYIWMNNVSVDFRTKRYRAMILRISPILDAFYFKFLEKMTDCKREQLIKETSGFPTWNYEFIEKEKQTKLSLSKLSKFLSDDKSKDKELAKSNKIIQIIKQCYRNKGNSQDLIDLRKIEENLRNPAAHSLSKVTEESIQTASGKTFEEIYLLLKKVYQDLYQDKRNLQLYDCYNKKIKELLNAKI